MTCVATETAPVSGYISADWMILVLSHRAAPRLAKVAAALKQRYLLNDPPTQQVLRESFWRCRTDTSTRFCNGPSVLTVDELGYLPMPAEDANAPFHVISQRYLAATGLRLLNMTRIAPPR